ncbi:MAG: hypothetical protein ACRYFK_19620 [Janthinobacterium lividum]
MHYPFLSWFRRRLVLVVWPAVPNFALACGATTGLAWLMAQGGMRGPLLSRRL